MVVGLFTTKEVASVPPKVTVVALPKLVPVIVTEVPEPPLVGIKDVTVGGSASTNVNVPAEVAVPPGVVTLILPVVPSPTTAVIVVAFTTLNDVAAVPPNETAVAPVKYVPVIVTVIPGAAVVGVKDVMVGASINVNPASDPVPSGVVTITLPEAPDPTTAVMVSAESTIYDAAAVPPKDTAEAPVKSVPVIVIVAPAIATVGVKFVTVGVSVVVYVNPANDADPPAVVTITLPEAPNPTTAVMIVEETTVYDLAASPPKKTPVAPVKLVPLIVIVAPINPEVGLKDVMVGAGTKVNSVKDAVPPAVVTDTAPVEPAPTTAVIEVADTTVNEVAAVTPKSTIVAPVKFVPVIVIVEFVPADVGVNEVMVGANAELKINPDIEAVPPIVVTLTLPDVPVPTTAVMVVAFTTVYDLAAVPPKVTAVAPVKPVPLIVTVTPVAAEVGVKDVMVGAGTKVNSDNDASPPGVITDTLPVVPVPTTALMDVAETTV
jgi:hypothetical protein